MSPVGALPSQKTKAHPDPLRARVLLHGVPKIGKSTLSYAWAPDKTLVVATPDQRVFGGEHYVQECSTWKDVDDTIGLVARGGHKFNTVVIDLIDDVWVMADRQAAKGKGVEAAGLVDWGKGFTEAEAMFRRVIGQLLSTPCGVWFVTHSASVEGADKKTRFEPTLNKRVLPYVHGACDYVLFAEAQGRNRVLHTQPSDRYVAGSRVGLPDPLPLDARALYGAIQQGYEKLENDGKAAV